MVPQQRWSHGGVLQGIPRSGMSKMGAALEENLQSRRCKRNCNFVSLG